MTVEYIDTVHSDDAFWRDALAKASYLTTYCKETITTEMQVRRASHIWSVGRLR